MSGGPADGEAVMEQEQKLSSRPGESNSKLGTACGGDYAASPFGS